VCAGLAAGAALDQAWVATLALGLITAILTSYLIQDCACAAAAIQRALRQCTPAVAAPHAIKQPTSIYPQREAPAFRQRTKDPV